MQIGVVYPQTELRGDPAAVRRIGRAVEDLGFDHLLAYDHVLGAVHADRTPPLTGPYTEHDPFHDPFVMFAYLAGITERIEFATGVLILPQRQTALVARQAADVDLLSGGRLRLGVGRRLEPRRVRGPRAGLPHPRRPAGGADRAAPPAVHRTGRRLLGPLRPGRPGRARAEAGASDPDLARRIGEAAFERAARLADGFIFFGGGLDDAVDAWNRLRERVRALGRSVEDFGADYVGAPAGGVDDRPRGSTPGARQVAPMSRWSRWASAWTPSTPMSTTSPRSRAR